MKKADIVVDVEMNFRQIISLIDLMLEHNNENSPNILTLRDLALSGLNKIIELDC